jgi:uncharacterized membrane protein
MAGDGGGVWIAILITIVASTACSVGKALQKEATRHLPRFSLEEKILRQYWLNTTWVAGLAADLGGGVIQIAAFALAPVSIVQPVSGVGLVGLAVYSHFFLKEKLQHWEWVAVGLAGTGTLGVGASSGGGAPPAAPPSPLRMLLVLSLVGAGVAALTAVRARQRARARRGAADKAAAALYGLQAGGCFGLSAACCRTGFIMAARRWTWAPFGLGASVALSGTGFVLQTCGLKEGSTVVVCTCVAVTSMATGVAVGLLGLGEPLPGSLAAGAARLLSWAMILGGVVALAAGPAGVRELAALALQRLPDRAWRLLPPEAAARVKGWSAAGRGLPEVHPGGAAGGGAAPAAGGAAAPSGAHQQ